jgi:allantoate deiminase
MTDKRIAIDRPDVAQRIGAHIETLARTRYAGPGPGVHRYAYTDTYRATLDYLAEQLAGLGYDVGFDPVGTLVARNRPAGEPAFGIGSHCDAVRGGGRWDGILGVVAGVELCRAAAEHHPELPLQLVSFLEEEGAGFGQALLGSRIATGAVTERELRETCRSRDDGRSFWDHATAAGHAPERWREATRTLDGLVGWIELHIEQGRMLQDASARVGVVEAIAGYVHGDLRFEGRADHAGATPMRARQDAALPLAETVVELERLAFEAGGGTVATVGEIELEPGVINVVPAAARCSLDVRGPDDEHVRRVLEQIGAHAGQAARRRGMSAGYAERAARAATPLDPRVGAALREAASAADVPWTAIVSGAAHDTMAVAPHVPSAMLFVPCRDGISHSPAEDADPADAAVGVEVMLSAIASLHEAALAAGPTAA